MNFTQTDTRILTIPRAVIFDMDGLLLDSEAIYCRAWSQAAGELGYTLSSDDYIQYAGRRTDDCTEDLMQTYGADFPLKRFFETQDVFYAEFCGQDGPPLKHGVLELLEYLENQNIPRAVATSTEYPKAIECLSKVAHRFDTIVTGDQVVNGKPDPEIFLLAAKKLGVPAGACLVLEDADPGLMAAQAAGMKAILVPDLSAPPEATAARASLVCGSLIEVQDVLRQCEGMKG